MGSTVQVGSPAHLDATGRPGVAADVRALEDQGRTAVLALRDGAPAGVLGIADRLRPDAKATLAALTELTGRTPPS